MDNSTPAPANYQEAIDTMGNHIHDRFMEFVEKEDIPTSKALMDEWIVDGVDPFDGEVEFIWADLINLD